MVIKFHSVRIHEDRCHPVVTFAHTALLFPVIKFRRSSGILRKVLVGNDHKKAQSEKDSHSKNLGGKKT